MNSDSNPSGVSKLVTAAAIIGGIAILYFGREVFIPLVLSGILAMLLSGPVERLEKMKVPRVAAVTLSVVLAFGVIVAVGWLVGVQVYSLANNIDRYQTEIMDKTHAAQAKFSGGNGGAIGKIEEIKDKVAKELNTPQTSATKPAQSSTQPATQRASDSEGIRNLKDALPTPTPEPLSKAVDEMSGKPPSSVPGQADAVRPRGTKDRPFYAVTLPAPASAIDTLFTYLGMTLSPLGTAGIVIVFVFFILLEREDLRDRLIRLVSNGRYTLTTTAMDDGLTRIIKYLRAQAIVNGTYGLAVGLGLLLIGYVFSGTIFPSFLLWGLLATILRFIPYIGPWIAASFPVTLALAAFHGFSVFIGVIALFLIIELISNNIMEPMLYGATTGLSTMAILVSAIFWTWLWGPIGLLLATPLTVLMMVLGRYVPALHFLEVLLGDRPAMTPSERVYQRLLAGDEDEALEVMESQVDESGLLKAYDEVLLPALAMSERDAAQGLLSEDRQEDVRDGTRRIIESLGEQAKESQKAKGAVAEQTETKVAAAVSGRTAEEVVPSSRPDKPPSESKSKSVGGLAKVALLPAHDEADELAALMLAQLLKADGLEVMPVTHLALASEMVEKVNAYEPHAVLISATPPAAVSHVKYLLRRLDNKLPQEQMTIGVWSARTEIDTLKRRLDLKATPVTVSLAEAVDSIRRTTEPVRYARTAESAAAAPA